MRKKTESPLWALCSSVGQWSILPDFESGDVGSNPAGTIGSNAKLSKKEKQTV